VTLSKQSFQMQNATADDARINSSAGARARGDQVGNGHSIRSDVEMYAVVEPVGSNIATGGARVHDRPAFVKEGALEMSRYNTGDDKGKGEGGRRD
jgi:hypothetical protein